MVILLATEVVAHAVPMNALGVPSAVATERLRLVKIMTAMIVMNGAEQPAARLVTNALGKANAR